MTPFDPIALLAMLQAFYPSVGPAAFARARRERPSYFSAGDIIGTSGDKLRLPDGRLFDCIFDTLGQNTRWQCIEVGTGPGGPDDEDPFALEAGPLVPIDLSAYPGGTPVPVFVPLVSSHLAALGATDGILYTAGNEVITHSDRGAVLDAWARTMDPAVEQLAAEGYALEALNPSLELTIANNQMGTIDANEGDYNESVPPPI